MINLDLFFRQLVGDRPVDAFLNVPPWILGPVIGITVSALIQLI